jgi:hypothetical protein
MKAADEASQRSLLERSTRFQERIITRVELPNDSSDR